MSWVALCLFPDSSELLFVEVYIYAITNPFVYDLKFCYFREKLTSGEQDAHFTSHNEIERHVFYPAVHKPLFKLLYT